MSVLEHMRSQRFAVGAARRRTSSSAFDSKKRSRSTVSTMYTTASTCWKYSDHTFRATVCPPRSNVRNLMLPMVSSSIAAQHTGRGLAPCARRAPPRSAPRPAGCSHLDAASGCAARCGHPSAGAGAWSCLHCPGRGTGSSRFCGRDLRAAVPVRGGSGGCSMAAPGQEAGGPGPRTLWQPRAPRGRQPRPTRGEGGLRRTQRAEHVPHPREHPHAGPAPPTRRGRLRPVPALVRRGLAGPFIGKQRTERRARWRDAMMQYCAGERTLPRDLWCTCSGLPVHSRIAAQLRPAARTKQSH